jgi:cell division protein FtsB
MNDPRREAVQPPIDFGPSAEASAVTPSEPDARRAAPRPPMDRATRRALLVLGAIALIGIVQVGFLTFVEIDRAVRHRAAITALQAELAQLRAEADALRAVAERADDATFREQLARGQGFVYPGERRIVVLDGAPAP